MRPSFIATGLGLLLIFTVGSHPAGATLALLLFGVAIYLEWQTKRAEKTTTDT